MANFTLIFLVALAVNVGISVLSSDWYKAKTGRAVAASQEELESKKKWHHLLRKYLLVYLLATLSDWLQGPYVYALYDEYGYAKHDIAVLFVAGFGSSMIFGSFVGGMADWGGRRAFVVLFAAIYALSCITKHFKEFTILMIGRLLGGIATSLLFSVFDAWLIRAHADAGLEHMLGKSFSWAAYGNSIVAIGAGLMANKAASMFGMIEITPNFIYAGGFLNPFDISLAALVVCGFFAYVTWDENFGATEQSAKGNAKWYDGLRNAFYAARRRSDIALCGAISSLYEGSMYIFVFGWTPAISAHIPKDSIPFGLVFSTFMVCCMAGSSLFSIQIEKYKLEELAIALFAVGAVAMGVMAISNIVTIKLIAMCVFEMTVGMYWPIMGTLKGAIVPENMRAAIYNLYRVPLNFIVVFSLLTDLTAAQSFILNAVMLSTATVLMIMLRTQREALSSGGEPPALEAETLLEKDNQV